MKLALAREELTGIVKGVVPPEVAVVDHLPDSVAVPSVLFGWSDPWLKPSTLCALAATMELVIVAQRIEPGGQLDRLEEIVGLIVPALKPTAYMVVDVTAPYPMQLAGVDYLAASVNIIYELEE